MKFRLAAMLAALIIGHGAAQAQDLEVERLCLEGDNMFCGFAADNLSSTDKTRTRKYAALACFDGYPRFCRHLVPDYFGKDAAAKGNGLKGAKIYCETFAGNPNSHGVVPEFVSAACYTAGYAYLVGDGVQQSITRGESYLRNAASLGSVYGLMAQCMLDGGSAGNCLERYR